MDTGEVVRVVGRGAFLKPSEIYRDMESASGRLKAETVLREEARDD